jgi:hypothetical protein
MNLIMRLFWDCLFSVTKIVTCPERYAGTVTKPGGGTAGILHIKFKLIISAPVTMD